MKKDLQASGRERGHRPLNGPDRADPGPEEDPIALNVRPRVVAVKDQLIAQNGQQADRIVAEGRVRDPAVDRGLSSADQKMKALPLIGGTGRQHGERDQAMIGMMSVHFEAVQQKVDQIPVTASRSLADPAGLPAAAKKNAQIAGMKEQTQDRADRLPAVIGKWVPALSLQEEKAVMNVRLQKAKNADQLVRGNAHAILQQNDCMAADRAAQVNAANALKKVRPMATCALTDISRTAE